MSAGGPTDAPWLAGVDGCRAGWVAAFVHPDGAEARVRVVPHFADVLTAPEAPAIVAVDVPIGLLTHSDGGRRVDALVRGLLLRRKSSLFPVPSRDAVHVATGTYADGEARRRAYQRACSVALATSTPPRRISIYTFGILPKIREVDLFLRANATACDRVYECHPEFAFQQLNRGRPIEHPKTIDAGLRLRRGLLTRAGLPTKLVNADAPRGAKPDDLLDALACAAVARRIHANEARSFPDPPGRDAFGLPMAIWV